MKNVYNLSARIKQRDTTYLLGFFGIVLYFIFFSVKDKKEQNLPYV